MTNVITSQSLSQRLKGFDLMRTLYAMALEIHTATPKRLRNAPASIGNLNALTRSMPKREYAEWFAKALGYHKGLNMADDGVIHGKVRGGFHENAKSTGSVSSNAYCRRVK
ncbi:hypothetical protein [[Curtobacterium] plantarum]|uniref:hypothetical protein n=1 Tax=[Curtobacterium] plantarum TaxID=221276 RepID=UPI000F08F8C9|nr:hypothetical protein [[Curtobacterium] plantarum]RNA78727.1 hypothetical protein EBO33_01495 [[Curtobacterium] plantarum]